MRISDWSSDVCSSDLFLRAGERVSVDDLLKGLITVSGNDAAAALAVAIDGSEEAFVRRMNDVAADIGMASSRFGTPNGWPDGGVTKVSAADLLTLADRLIRDHQDRKSTRLHSNHSGEHSMQSCACKNKKLKHH